MSLPKAFDAEYDQLLKVGRHTDAHALLLNTLARTHDPRVRLSLASLWAHMEVIPALTLSIEPGSVEYDNVRECLNLYFEEYDRLPADQREILQSEDIVLKLREIRDRMREGVSVALEDDSPSGFFAQAMALQREGRPREAIEVLATLLPAAPTKIERMAVAGMIASIYSAGARTGSFDLTPGSKDYLGLRDHLRITLDCYDRVSPTEQAEYAHDSGHDMPGLRILLNRLEHDQSVMEDDSEPMAKQSAGCMGVLVLVLGGVLAVAACLAAVR